MTSPSKPDEIPVDEHEAWRADELRRMRLEHETALLLNEPICAECKRRIGICLCGHGLP